MDLGGCLLNNQLRVRILPGVPYNIAMLTEQEKHVLNLLAESWNEFSKLPVQHPSHADEFTVNIHQAQRIIMCRSVSRDEGWVIKENNAS